ncbi:MAG TPA: FAD-dependent oxidoreductase [Oligoflexia bacterium]|nr:FAD-dependent oxidoreductase [Oligoflexia bacterium]HMP27692.1 FAD-dependent oxidoreductase [Oligoflexia bacterium]
MSYTNTIAVIGAGPAGLPTIKELAKEDLKVVAFEQRANLGGMWSDVNGYSWQGMQTNLSKYTCCYSTYPHAKQTPDFPLSHQMGDYLQLFAKSSRLEDYIRLEHKVREIIPTPNGWQVIYQNKSGQEKVEFFSKVVIATGFFLKQYCQKFKGKKIFPD